MSTPAAAALDGAVAPSAGADKGAGGAGPGAGAGSVPGSGTAAPAANEAFYSSWIKADAPDATDLKTWLGNKNFPDPATLVKSYRGLETEAGSLRAAANLKGFPADTKNPDGTVKKADPNAVQAWRTLQGVPATPAEYNLEIPQNAPFPQFVKLMEEMMHEVGVPPAMAHLLNQGYERKFQQFEAIQKEAENRKIGEDMRALEVEWGPNFKEREQIAMRGRDWLAKEAGGLDDMQQQALVSILTAPKFMKAMWKIGAGNQELSFPPGGGSGDSKGFSTNSTSELQERWAQNQADRSAGKISLDVYRARERELADAIAQGYPTPAN